MTETATETTTPLPRLPMTKALKALIATVTGKPCEIRTIPKVGNVAVDAPYTILYPLWSTYDGPPFFDPHADVTWNYQVTVAVKRGDQAEHFHDKIVEAIVGRGADGVFLHDLAVDGMSVMARDLGSENDDTDGGSSGEDTKAGIITHDVRFSVTVTPV